MNRPLPILVCCLMASATYAGQKFDAEEWVDIARKAGITTNTASAFGWPGAGSSPA
jgi:hypothetical protein